MKILIVSRFFPYPEVTHAGGTNLFHYIEALGARGHEISLVSFIKERERPYVESMRSYCAEIEVVPGESSLGQRLAKAHYALRYPMQWVEAASPAMRRALSSMLGRRRFDIVHLEHLWLAQYLDLVDGPKTAVDEVDVDSVVLLRRARQAQSWLEKRYLDWCWRRTVELEIEACERIDLILARSDKDRQYLRCLAPGQNIRELLPWFEGVSKPPHPHSLVEEHSLLFVGDMRRINNVEAVVYFCRDIYPQILEAVPDAKLYIAGADPSARVKALANEHVVVTGFVEDLASYYARCQIFVAPLLVGGGIIIKILDALAAGRPTVCTSMGNEGIDALPGRDLYIADSPDLFARRTIELLTDTQKWREMAANARRFVEYKYDWEAIMDGLEDAYREVLTTV